MEFDYFFQQKNQFRWSDGHNYHWHHINMKEITYSKGAQGVGNDGPGSILLQ